MLPGKGFYWLITENCQIIRQFLPNNSPQSLPNNSQSHIKDRDVLLTFYDFPAEHWTHLRTTNPIESTFATVRLRTNKTRGMLTRDTMLTMVFKLSRTAQARWRRLNRPELLGELIEGIQFKDGIKQEKQAA